MSYVTPYEVIKKNLNMQKSGAKKAVELRPAELTQLIKTFLRGISIDESWYLRTYPDVAAAVRVGTYKSARHHFIEEGYFEGRIPAPPTIDEQWYVKNNPDVAAGLKSGTIQSARQHFEEHGYKEGRLPSEY